MPKPAKGARLGGSSKHERHILHNLAKSLFEHGAITTTESRAKRLQPLAERLISKAKRGDLHNIRQVAKVIRSQSAAFPGAEGDAGSILHKLVAEIAPSFADRNGGYTRITKLAPRKGDQAPLALIELVTEPVSPKQAVVREAEKATEKAAKKPAKKAAAAEVAAEEAPAEEVVAEEAAVAEAAAEETSADAEETAEDADKA